MIREKVLLIIGLMGIVSYITSKLTFDKPVSNISHSIYDFKIKSLAGKEIDFEQYRDKKLLIVNTASKCGYTYQYKDLQNLHEKYGDKVAVLGFPANNFLWQEPGTNEDIASFCDVNYGVTFQLFEKTSVIGRTKHPLYRWLEAKSGKVPSWNFCKYLVDEKGNFVAFFPATVNPLDDSILELVQ
jgi:glutathione peroxidase